MKNIFKLFVISILLIFITNSSNAQNATTKVEGYITDAVKGDTISFANIQLKGTTIGTTSDERGYFRLVFKNQTVSELLVSFVGYQSITQKITLDQSQFLTIKMSEPSVAMSEVVVKSGRYRNKNNPAVALIDQIIAHKKYNKLENHDYYEYKKYEKLELDLTNISDKVMDKKVFKNVDFFFADKDTTKVKGKTTIPAFFLERATDVYYRKSTNTTKQYINGTKQSNLDGVFDEENVETYLNHLYVNINIYDNEVLLFKKPFLSPLAPTAPQFYRYYIIDTTQVEGTKCINLGFFPRSKADLTFVGNLYVVADSTYAIRKVTVSVPKEININFLNDLKIEQTFSPSEKGSWLLTRDEISIDFGVGDKEKGSGLYGKKISDFTNFIFNKPQKDDIYSGFQNITKCDKAMNQSDEFWNNARTVELNKTEKNIYDKTEKLVNTKDYQNFIGLKYFMTTGYLKFKNIEIGPFTTLVSHNNLEGTRVRLGGRTLYELNHHFRLDGYGAYGFSDKRFKYSATITIQLNDNYFNNRPQKAFNLWAYHDVEVPGRALENIQADNILLSFGRGKFDKMYYKRAFGLKFIRENERGFMFQIGVLQKKLTPAGSLIFNTLSSSNELQKVENITTNEANLKLKYAPNEEFFQGKTYRKRIVNKYPIFGFSFTTGLGSDAAAHKFNYASISADVFKRFFLAPIGHADVKVEAGRTFGRNLPFPVLNVLSSNQTLNYEEFSYNQMNYLEFITDKHVSLNIEHAFDGFFLNKIPLIKKLKLREYGVFKAVYGSLDNANSPLTNNNLYLFPTNKNGQSLTYDFGNKPYMETGIGIGNIFTIFRVDFTRRLTYLDNANVSKWRIQGKVMIDF